MLRFGENTCLGSVGLTLQAHFLLYHPAAYTCRPLLVPHAPALQHPEFLFANSRVLDDVTLFYPVSQVSEVEADLELIVDNATTFNRPNDPVYQFALELQTVFRSELSLIRRAGGGGHGGREDGQVDKRPRIR